MNRSVYGYGNDILYYDERRSMEYTASHQNNNVTTKFIGVFAPTEYTNDDDECLVILYRLVGGDTHTFSIINYCNGKTLYNGKPCYTFKNDGGGLTVYSLGSGISALQECTEKINSIFDIFEEIILENMSDEEKDIYFNHIIKIRSE